MTFWSGETLKARLPKLIAPGFDEKRIDCAAYALTLGNEVFVTSDLPDVGTAVQGVKQLLLPNQQIRIAPGQFAFLLTAESISVPSDAIAFISMKARYKFRGLINVSGFHVDPGFSGHLVFSVYNAGSSPVALTQGAELFLVWYASLDRDTQMLYDQPGKGITDDLISNMSGQVFSPIALKTQIERLAEKISKTKEDTVNTNTDYKILKNQFDWHRGIAITIVGIFASALWYLYSQQRDIKEEVERQKLRATAELRAEPARLTPAPSSLITPKAGEEAKRKVADLPKSSEQKK
jgi:dCTP deaminase